ncbi:kinesin-associated protein 3-like [Ischnura elegans]|uniref:kinesin-associated protein 3-like n=1 Tax=Ischnura elegans TaxID=197161 RepID=UPI001ED891F1|nr:kinesin-associated protein 3-like [Ischnura elegans]
MLWELEVKQRKRALKLDSGLYDLQQRMNRKWESEQFSQPQSVSSTIDKMEEISLLPKIIFQDSEEELEPRVKPGETEYEPSPLPQGPTHVMQQTSYPFSKRVPQVERRKSTGPWDCKQQVHTGATSPIGTESSSPPTVQKWEHLLEQRKVTRKLNSRVPTLSETSPSHDVDQSPALSEVIHTLDTSDSIEDATSVRIDVREFEKIFDLLVKQQNKLLRASLCILYNLADSWNLEEQIAKKNIVGLLINFLDRNNTELLLVLLTFLNELSQMRDHVISMAKFNVVDKLQRLVSWPSVDVSYESLKLIMNLSANGSLQTNMIDTGMIPCLVKVLAAGDTMLHINVYKILYHFSLNNNSKAMFPDTGSIQIAMRQVVHRAQRGETFALAAALLVNLALYEQNAQIMCTFNYREGDPDLSALLGTVPEKYADGIVKSKSDKDQGLVDLFICSAIEEHPLTMKIVRNISHHEDLHHLFWEYINDILHSCKTSKNEDYVAEVLGCFGNIIIPKLDYERLFRHYNVIDFFKSKLIPGFVADDVVLLELLKILGTVAAESHNSAEFLCKEDFVRPFVRMLRDKSEDEEFILYLLDFIYLLLKYEKSRKYVLEETDAAAFAYQLKRYGKNEQVSKACDAVFRIIAAYDEHWKAKIVTDSLEHHNKKWLKMVGKPDDGATGTEGEDYTSDFEDAASGCLTTSKPEDPGLGKRLPFTL